MSESDDLPSDELEPANLLLIVVGAHLRAEVADRPLAYRLRQHIIEWLEAQDTKLNILMTPVVCSDVWYVNQETLQKFPTISLGGPGVNALSAYYAKKVETAMVRDDQMVIQLDPEYVDLRACIWGRDHDLTAEALERFVNSYLDDYLRAVVTQVEPQE